MKNAALPSYRFIEKLKKVPGIKRNTERSDIDLAIDCPDVSAAEWNIVADIIEHADTLLTVDYIRFDTLSVSNPLRTSIERDGVIIFQKDSHE